MCPVFVCLQYLNVDSGADRPHSAPGTSSMISQAYQDAMTQSRPKSTPSAQVGPLSSDSLSLSLCSQMEGSQNMNISGYLDGGSRQPTPTLSTPTPSQHSPGTDITH